MVKSANDRKTSRSSKPTIPKANPSSSSGSQSKKPVSSTKPSSTSTHQTPSISNKQTKNKSTENSKKNDRSTQKSNDNSKKKSDEKSKKSDQNSQKSDPTSKKSKSSGQRNSNSSGKAKDKSTVYNTIRNIFYCNSCMKPPTTITHRSHPQHPLEKINRQHYSHICDGCKMRGVGDRYACKPCGYNLHEDCALPRSSIKFQGQKCKFLERPRGSRSCSACGMAAKGFVYHCEEEKTDFHPSCTNLKDKIRIQDVIFKLEKKVSSKCLRCQKKNLEGTSRNIRGWSYVSNHNGYTIHVHCLMDLAVLLSSPTTTISDKKGASSSSSSSAMLKGGAKTGIGGDKWIKVLEIFLKLILPLLIGAHPATFVLSLAAVGVKELVGFLME